METHKNSPSILNKSLNWIANHTYRRIPTLINSYQRTSTSPKKLSFEDYILTPSLAREAGLMYVRQLRRDYLKQKEGISSFNKFTDIEKVISEYKSNTDLLNEKPHELLCPICLELFSGPVTTSCNHTFCRMCIDESILFSPSCPSCRKNIRAEELIVSKATEAIIRMLLYKLDTEEVEKFVKKELEYQEWLERRTPKRSELHKGQIIDVRDTEHVWCKGSIIEILPQNVTDPEKYEYLLVHYEGWASRFDEVISLESLRLASCGFYMSRYEIPHYNLDPNNPEHYRCPVVTGPPRPVVPVIPEPEEEEIDSSDSELSLVSEVPEQEQEQSINSGIHSLFVPEEEEQSEDGHNHIEMNISVNDRNPSMGSSSSSYGINNNNEDNLEEEVFDNRYQQLDRIYAIREPPTYNDANEMLWLEEEEMNADNNNQNTNNNQNADNNNQNANNNNHVDEEHQERALHHDHSLLEVRQLQLLENDFGERIYLYLQPEEQQESGIIMMPTNSEVDQQIVNMVNQEQEREQQREQEQEQQLKQEQEQEQELEREREQEQELLENLENCMVILPNPSSSQSHSDNLILTNHHNIDSNIRDNPEFRLEEKDNQLEPEPETEEKQSEEVHE